MVNLKEVVSSEQVYSEELNEILIKTPPRLFKVAIVIFTVLMITGLLGGFLIDSERNKQYDYILFKDDRGKNTVVIFSTEDISSHLDNNAFKLYPAGASRSSAAALSVRADSFSRDEIYSINNVYTKLEGRDVEALPDISNLEVHYKYYLYLPDAPLASNFDDYRVGVLYLPMGKQSLLRLFTGS